MNLLKTILFSVFGIIISACGGSNGHTVKVAKIENGVPKSEDGRIILSSESGNLIIPDGVFEGIKISSTKFASKIEDRFDMISKVYDLSMTSGFYLDDIDIISSIIGQPDKVFTVSFSVQTVSGNIHRGFECKSHIVSDYLALSMRNCKNDQGVILNKRVYEDLESIVAEIDRQKLQVKMEELRRNTLSRNTLN